MAPVIKTFWVTTVGNICVVMLAVVDGHWSPWSEWSQCDMECKQYRARNCSSPAPSHGGRPCEGEGVQVLSCVTGLCKGNVLKREREISCVLVLLTALFSGQ